MKKLFITIMLLILTMAGEVWGGAAISLGAMIEHRHSV